jgi:hypothetical protein
MYQQLLNHSADLKQLENDGYEVEIKEKHLLIHNVPYVTTLKVIQRGTFVSTLNHTNEKTLAPETHVVFFSGDFPCDKNGNPIEKIRHETKGEVHGGISTQHSFSNKPAGGFKNYYDKMTNYINIVSSPAFSIDNTVTAKTFKPIKVTEEESIFNYFDSNSSRSGILELSEKFANEKVGIIGVGGTGSYILDLVSKTPVREIHLFDGKKFVHHNAFRAPGAASLSELENTPYKVDYFKNKYSNMHRGVHAHAYYLDSNNISILKMLTFVFISIDDSGAKKVIIEFLKENKINFIDVGMGIEVVDKKLRGTMRVTTGLFNKTDHISKRISFADMPDDDYHKNIQTAELNALNAILAVIKWKKLLGYYHDYEQEHNTYYDIDGNHITNDEKNNS